MGWYTRPFAIIRIVAGFVLGAGSCALSTYTTGADSELIVIAALTGGFLVAHLFFAVTWLGIAGIGFLLAFFAGMQVTSGVMGTSTALGLLTAGVLGSGYLTGMFTQTKSDDDGPGRE